MDEYKDWPGGRCPVSPSTQVSVVFRDGHVEESFADAFPGWEHSNGDGMSLPENWDIVKYKLVN